jgi:hypothetical protein
MKTVDPVKHDIMIGLRSTKWPELIQHSRIQRKAEKQGFDRYVRSLLAGRELTDPINESECVHGCVGDPDEPCRTPVCLVSCHMFTTEEVEGCRHGCSGSCERFGSDVCTFLCHPRWEEMFGLDHSPIAWSAG